MTAQRQQQHAAPQRLSAAAAAAGCGGGGGGGAQPQSPGRKRAGGWLNTELDLDDYWCKSKRFKAEEISCDLSSMNLQEGGGCHGSGGGGSGGGGHASGPAASSGSMQVCSVEGGSPPQAMQQSTPRSESRTPSVHGAGGGGGGGGGQASVHSGGRHRLGHRATPMRLLDTLNLHPTSPSDPGLEGQLDLRKATLMRSLQTRLLKRDADGTSPPAPAPMVVGAAAAGGEQPGQPPLQPLQPLQLTQQQAARLGQPAELALPAAAACAAVHFFPPPPPAAHAPQAAEGSLSPDVPPSIAAEASCATMSE